MIHTGSKLPPKSYFNQDLPQHPTLWHSTERIYKLNLRRDVPHFIMMKRTTVGRPKFQYLVEQICRIGSYRCTSYLAVTNEFERRRGCARAALDCRYDYSSQFTQWHPETDKILSYVVAGLPKEIPVNRSISRDGHNVNAKDPDTLLVGLILARGMLCSD